MSETVQCSYCGMKHNSLMHECPFCGGQRAAEKFHETPVCPRCNSTLTLYTYRDNTLDICPECLGLWLDISEFNRLTSERDVYSDDSIPYEFQREPFPEENGYLPCARCGKLMVRKNFQAISGVLIDICGRHGVWLDAGELDQIRCFIANGGLEKYQNKQIIENKEQIRSLARDLKEVEFMQNILHHWNLKHWIFKNM
jgi:Zn-finger nucleic acid-binding protein